MIDTIIFDIGNVLIPWEPKWLYQHFFDSEAAIEHFLHDSEFHAWNILQDAGRPFAEGVAEHRARFPQYGHLMEAYAQRWRETLGPQIDGSVALIHECKRAGYRLLALTNMSHETFPRVCTDYPFLNEFEGVVVSGRERLIKPQPEIYALLCQRHSVIPSKAVFIDDSLTNIEAAQAFGLHGVHFTSPENTRHALKQLGLPL